ncbi:MAG: TraB/GumN family protein [Crocinitomicaceae bacterium]|nr:TraB/GumN family protein [Crocinitomicaceae bacterium]
MTYLRFLILFIGLPSFAQDTQVTPFPMEESALLWQITTSTTADTSYLFGTMHLIEEDYFLFPEKLKNLAANSDALVMELAGLPDPNESMALVMLKEGSFFDYFDKKQTDSIIAWAEENMNVSEEMFRATFDKMKPFAVASLAMQYQFKGETRSYEKTFGELAKENEIETIGLETVREQMGFFDDLTKKEQTSLVMESIRDGEEAQGMLKQMQQIYFNQEVDSLYMLVLDKGGTFSDKEADFLDNRNSNWTPKIEAIIQEKKAFIAVGAGHLGGPKGVIRLLEKEGYTLTPIRL